MNAVLDWAAAVDPRLALVALLLALNTWSTGLTLATDAPRREKALWIAVIFLCPIIGGMFWFVFGPKPRAEKR